MADKKKRPKLRFEGFTDHWKDKKLNLIADIIGGGTPSTSVSEYWNGDIDWYSPTEIGNEVYAKGSVNKITVEGYENSSAKILPPNKTILFTSRAGIGDMAILQKEGCTNQGFQSLVLNNGHDPYFIYSAGHLIKKYALSKASGSTFLEISGKILGKMELAVPESEIEQQQVGSFFKNIDELITKHQNKHKRLVTLKKSMLEKMFPKEGQSVPEIRFKGFEGDWEECEFQEIATIKRGLTYSPSNLRKTGTRVLRSSNIFENRFINRVDDVFVDDTAINIEYVKEGDILITAANGSSKLVGKHALIIGAKGKVVHGGFMLLASSNVPLFLNASMSSSWYKKFVILYTAGGGGSIGNLNKSDLDQQKIYVPADGNEQLKIGKYFQNIDTLITNHLEQLQKLKNFKQSLSEKMFV